MAQLCTSEKSEIERTTLECTSSESSKRSRSRRKVGYSSTRQKTPMASPTETCAQDNLNQDRLERIYKESLELSIVSKRLADLIKPIIDSRYPAVEGESAEYQLATEMISKDNSELIKSTRTQRQRRRQGKNYQKVADMMLSPRKPYVRFTSPT